MSLDEVEGAEVYNPYAEDIKAIDQCYMFHIQPKWLEPMMKKIICKRKSLLR